MPHNPKYPAFTSLPSCLEFALQVDCTLTSIEKIGYSFSALWAQHAIAYTVNPKGMLRIPSKSQRALFQAGGPFHREIVEHGLPLKWFLNSGGKTDQSALLISPSTAMGVMRLGSSFREAIALGLRKNETPVVVFHWVGGEDDWNGARCVLPQYMRAEALQRAFSRLRTESSLVIDRASIAEIMSAINLLKIEIPSGSEPGSRLVRVHFATPPLLREKVLIAALKDFYSSGAVDLVPLLTLNRAAEERKDTLRGLVPPSTPTAWTNHNVVAYTDGRGTWHQNGHQIAKRKTSTAAGHTSQTRATKPKR